jgi:(heptosyl)LPS beta-1,4-glucosyltransferase
MFLGKWIRHCGWYPGRVVRLFRKSSARFGGGSVHERLEAGTGAIEVRSLDADLLHYTDETLFHYFVKFNRYTSLAAADLSAGRRASLRDMTVRPAFQFFKMYLLRLGFLDGIHGLVLCLLSASYVWVKYAKLWEATTGRAPD